MNINTLIDELTKLAATSPKFELCGVVDNLGTVYSIENTSKTPERCFVFHKRQYLKLLSNLVKEGRKVFCIFHTHPNGDTTPSNADVEFASRIHFPSLIVTTSNFRWVN